MPIYRYPLGPLNNNSYLILDDATRDAAVVDPSFDSDQLLEFIQNVGCTVRYILNTHAHFDHIFGNTLFHKWSGAPIALHTADLELLRSLPEQCKWFGVPPVSSPEPSLFLEDQQCISIGDTQIKVLFTPGHSRGHVSFLIEQEGVVISGDSLFRGSIGRTDLPGGSSQTLLQSIRSSLLTLPDSYKVFAGHGEATTIGEERDNNPFLRMKTM